MQYCANSGPLRRKFQEDFPVGQNAHLGTEDVLSSHSQRRGRRGLTKSSAATPASIAAALGFLVFAASPACAAESKIVQTSRIHHRVSPHRLHAADDATASVGDVAATNGISQVGFASFYGPRHQGRKTASGALFEQDEMTAAHPWLPFGTRVLVTDRATGRQVIVTVTDRLGTRRRLIDLSLGAARELGMISRGVASVELTPL